MSMVLFYNELKLQKGRFPLNAIKTFEQYSLTLEPISERGAGLPFIGYIQDKHLSSIVNWDFCRSWAQLSEWLLLVL